MKKAYHAHGFTLAEIMIALAVFSISIPTILTLQGTLLTRARKARTNNTATIALQNYVTQAHQEFWQESPNAVTMQDGQSKRTYKTQPIPEESSLKKYSKTLRQEQTTYSDGEETTTVYSYIFIPPTTQEDKKAAQPKQEKTPEKKQDKEKKDTPAIKQEITKIMARKKA